MAVRNLDKLFRPQRVAMLGAPGPDRHLEEALLRNMLDGGFQGVVYPVIPGRESMAGVSTYSNTLMLPHAIDLALICRPAELVPAAVRECGVAGVPSVLILSPGYRETDKDCDVHERQLREAVRRFPNMRVLGPNSLGIINTALGLNASLSPSMPRSGRLTFLSQSRTLSSAILDRAAAKGVRLAYFVSLGTMINVGLGDLIDYFSGDGHTRSLILYLNTVNEPRQFMSAARAFARLKPIVAYKAGRHVEAARAAASHTGHLVAEDLVYEAAFQRAGIVRAMELDDIFDVAELLASQRLPHGPRLAIVSNSAAAAVVATDSLLSHQGELAELSDQTVEKLDSLCPCNQPVSNPVTIAEDASAECFANIARVVAGDKHVDAVAVLLTPQLLTEPTATARRLASMAQMTTKPVLAAWIGGHRVRKGISILNQAGLPTHGTPEHAVRAFMHLVSYARNLAMIYETPKEVPVELNVDRAALRGQIQTLVDAGRLSLDPVEAEQLLTSYGIPVCPSRMAENRDEAVRLAEVFRGRGVAIKALTAPPMIHKTDHGGVMLDLRTPEQVAQAFDRVTASVSDKPDVQRVRGVTVQPMASREDVFEMILGAKKDPTFGPVVMIGMGGIATDIIQDRAVGLPPINEHLARHMIESLRAWPLLKGYRGQRGINVDRLIEVLIRFSYLVANHPKLAEVEINPLIVSDTEVLALDASVQLDPDARVPLDRPYQHLAIRPYPEEYVREVELKDGSRVCLRPIRPEDEPRWHELLAKCSDRSIRNRFRSMFQRMSHDMASRYCFIDYDREITLVGEVTVEGETQFVAAGGLAGSADRHNAEFSVIVVDLWQGKGLGGTLLDYCLQIAEAWGFQEVLAETDPANHRMIAAFRRRDFIIQPFEWDDDAVYVSKPLHRVGPVRGIRTVDTDV